MIGGIFVTLAAIGGVDGAEFETDFDSDFDVDLGSTDFDADLGNLETDIAGAAEPDDDQKPPPKTRRFLAFILPLLSLRFWTFGSFIFGLMGLLLTFLQPDLGSWERALISGITGILFGIISVATLRWLSNHGQTNSLIRAEDLVGACGIVEIPFDQDSRGKIKLEVKGTQFYLQAMTTEAKSLEVGDRVLVLGMEDNRAWVVSEESAQSV